ncbi:hypothetical protein ACFOOM_12330 [Streptomyces echinoruber]|uniref:Uncharacterized protein n=1 Tax=Streptomyces echinoruber TaxID=68898 RepID=A0A918RMT4_9ACTN|nr:hypothetical protein [Streptomyces echinoruber]GHA01208.1 hypothetical protein GCM10010389_45670 [Streptomyces echinoruber]
MPDTSGIPTAPVDTEPIGFYARDAQAAALRDTLTAAGVELGAYDTRIVNWLAGLEWSTLAVIASWVARAAQIREPAPAIALPSRFDATPTEIDQHLRRILAEDTYLRYQQAIGNQAAQDVRATVRPEMKGIDQTARYVSADEIDPLKGGGPYPSQLLCSQHDGFGPCPSAPACTSHDTPKDPQ